MNMKEHEISHTKNEKEKKIMLTAWKSSFEHVFPMKLSKYCPMK